MLANDDKSQAESNAEIKDAFDGAKRAREGKFGGETVELGVLC